MKKIIFFVLSIFIIQSCVDSTRDFTDIGTPPPGIKVVKKIKVNKVGGIPYEINYNWTSGKLTSISTSNNSSSYILEYNGKELKKITQTIGQGSQLKTTVSNLVYNSGKLTVINGTENTAATGTLNFTTAIGYTGNYPSTIHKLYQNGGITTVESILLEYKNTNISKINYILGNGPTAINTEINLSNYDEKKNPINTLPIAFSISDSYVNEDTFGVLGLSINNFKTENIQNTGIVNTVFTYDTDGYPTKSVKPDLILEFEYKSI